MGARVNRRTLTKAILGAVLMRKTTSEAAWYASCLYVAVIRWPSSDCHGFASAVALSEMDALYAKMRLNDIIGSHLAGAPVLCACRPFLVAVAAVAASHSWRAQKSFDSDSEPDRGMDWARRWCATQRPKRLTRTTHSAKGGSEPQPSLLPMDSGRKPIRTGCWPLWKTASGIGRRVHIWK